MTKMSKFLNIILRPLDNVCNLYCEYCNVQFAFHKYTDCSSHYEFSAERWAPLLISQINDLPGLQKVYFTWHGGEPLLFPKEFFEKVVQWQTQYLRKDLRWSNVIQTNALLLDNDCIDSLRNLDMHIGVSIDGPEYEHNQFRFSSPYTFRKVLGNIALLRDKDVPYSLFLVIHEANYRDAKKIMDFFHEMNPRVGVSLPPRFTHQTSFLDPGLYRDFLIELFDLWWPDCVINIGIFGSILRGLDHGVPSLCYLNGRCDGFINIDSQGNVYSTCEWNPWLKIGSLYEYPFKQIMVDHLSDIAHNLERIKNRKFFEILDFDTRYIYFQGKGCLNRLVKERDPYVIALAEVISHIDKTVHEYDSPLERRDVQ